MTHREITPAEARLMTHVMMFGSDGYPVQKLGPRSWTWGTDQVPGPPTTWPTKREAVASFEAFIDVLIEAKGAAARRCPGRYVNGPGKAGLVHCGTCGRSSGRDYRNEGDPCDHDR